MYRLEFEVCKRFNRLLMVAHGVSVDNVRRAARFIERPVNVGRRDVEFVDSLSYDEGLLVCAY
ncbi:MAG: hypothetical protein ACP5PQ_07435, partial [Thermoproteota archaeon]